MDVSIMRREKSINLHEPRRSEIELSQLIDPGFEMAAWLDDFIRIGS